MKVAVVIPAYNEAERIGAVLEKLPKQVLGLDLVAIVVDDGSKDKTYSIAKEAGVKALRHRVNMGKGAAAKTGCDAATKLKADIIVLMDADGQHRPEDIEKMIKPLVDTTEDEKPVALVVGTRRRNKNMPFTMRFGNKVMNSIARASFGITTQDTQSGFRAFRREVYPRIRWAANNYAMEIEMLILAFAQKLPVAEVSIATIYHDNYKGTTVLDGLRILRTILKWKLLWFREFNSLESFSL